MKSADQKSIVKLYTLRAKWDRIFSAKNLIFIDLKSQKMCSSWPMKVSKREMLKQLMNESHHRIETSKRNRDFLMKENAFYGCAEALGMGQEHPQKIRKVDEEIPKTDSNETKVKHELEKKPKQLSKSENGTQIAKIEKSKPKSMDNRKSNIDPAYKQKQKPSMKCDRPIIPVQSDSLDQCESYILLSMKTALIAKMEEIDREKKHKKQINAKSIILKKIFGKTATAHSMSNESREIFYNLNKK